MIRFKDTRFRLCAIREPAKAPRRRRRLLHVERELVEMKYLPASHPISANLNKSLRTFITAVNILLPNNITKELLDNPPEEEDGEKA